MVDAGFKQTWGELVGLELRKIIAQHASYLSPLLATDTFRYLRGEYNLFSKRRRFNAA